MLPWFKQRSNKPTEQKPSQRKRRFQNEVLSGVELLKDPQRTVFLKETKSSISINQAHWEELYYSLISNFAAFVQMLPASEGHHHSYAGGLLDHSLEVMQYAVRARRGVLYPRGGKEDLISQKADIFTYAVASAALLHDVGKAVTDLLVVHTVPKQDEPKIWTPTTGKMPVGQSYVWRSNSNKTHKLHEIAGLQIIPSLIPEKGQMWLFSDQELYQLWVSAISGQYGQAGLLGELVQNADQESVQGNIGKMSAMPVALNRFQQTKANTISMFTNRLVQVLRDELQKGEIRLNVAGAGGWVKDNRIYLVSKRAAEMLRNKMLADESVSKSTPKNPITIINMLNDANLLIRNADGEAIYYFNIVDRKFKKNEVWQQTLSFIVFDQELLDPNKTLGVFDGEITEVTRLEPIAEDEPEPESEKMEAPVSNSRSKKSIEIDIDDLNTPVEVKEQTREKSSPDKTNQEKTEVEVKPKPSLDNPPTKIRSRLADGVVPFASRTVTKQGESNVAWDVEVNNWIKLMLKHKQITYNQPNSQIHIVERKVCLVTPAIFIVFINENTQLIESLPEFENLSRSQIQKTIQRKYLTNMKRNILTGFSGDNMLTVLIKGQRKRSKMTVIALKDGSLIFDEIPSNNNVLEWDSAPMF